MDVKRPCSEISDRLTRYFSSGGELNLTSAKLTKPKNFPAAAASGRKISATAVMAVA